jgi:hypothetical protein
VVAVTTAAAWTEMEASRGVRAAVQVGVAEDAGVEGEDEARRGAAALAPGRGGAWRRWVAEQSGVGVGENQKKGGAAHGFYRGGA